VGVIKTFLFGKIYTRIYKDNYNKYKDSCSTSRRLELNHALVANLAHVVLQISLVPWSKDCS